MNQDDGQGFDAGELPAATGHDETQRRSKLYVECAGPEASALDGRHRGLATRTGRNLTFGHRTALLEHS